MVKKLTREKLIQLVDNVLSPKGRGFASGELNQQLLLFCVNCPDPIAAMDVVVETRPPVTASELVDRALAYPRRDVAGVPETELASTHPLRYMRLEE